MTLLVGRQEGHLACKKYGEDGGGGHWLVWMEWRPAGWSVCLPLLIFPCTIKSRSSLLAPAQPGGFRKRAVKQLWCGVMVVIIIVIIIKEHRKGAVQSEKTSRTLSLQGVFHGVTGVVTKPIEGAKQEGVGGFFKGATVQS